MLKLYAVRHAKSSWAFQQLHDIDRPLKRKGIKRAIQMARILKERGAKPDAVISSPSMRTCQTALLFGTVLRYNPEKITLLNTLYEAGLEDVKKMISKLADSDKEVMFFGHHPSITDLANTYLDEPLAALPTGSIALLTSKANKWSRFISQPLDIELIMPH
ncbi:MAG: histidine phosphatase family protein [Flavobacteriales bacterium]|nr:histidine phosphatase family protein [Flavobacteriales bacterium]